MAISVVGTGTAAASTTNPSTVLPTGIQANDLILIYIGTKPDANTQATVGAGYTSLGSSTGGTGTSGIDVGPMRAGIHYKIADGTESGATYTPTIPNNNVSSIRSQVFRCAAGKTWDLDYTNGSDATTATPLTATGAAWSNAVTSGDWIVVHFAVPTDSGTAMTSVTLTQTGLTFGTPTHNAMFDTTTGQDMGMSESLYPVTAGTSSSSPTYSTALTSASNLSGPVVFVRIREAAATLQGAVAMTATATMTVPARLTQAASVAMTATHTTQATIPSTVSIVGKRNLQTRGFITGNTSYTYRVKYPVAVSSTGLQLTYAAWGDPDATSGDTATGNTVTIGAAYVEYGGVAYPVTFGGASSIVISSGGTVTSDAVSGLNVTAGTTAYIRTYVTVPSGGRWPNLYGAYIYPDEIGRPGVNLANGTGDLQGTGQTISDLFGPIVISGAPTSGQPKYAIVIIGDSRVAGVNDSFSTEDQVGYWQRALYPTGNTRPYRIVALPSESAAQYLAANGALRRATVGTYAHYFINQYGINDLQGSATLAQLQSRVLSIGATMDSQSSVKKRLQETLPPKTSSTDGWTTVGNQTTDGLNATRVQFNDWVRDGMPTSGGVAVATGTIGALRAGGTGHPFTGYIDVADLCESAHNSGLWKANYTNDGLHLNPSGNASVAAGLDLSIFTDTSGPATQAGAVSMSATHALTPTAGGSASTLTGNVAMTESSTLTSAATVAGGGGGTATLVRTTANSALKSSAFQGTGLTQAWTSNTFSPPANSVIVLFLSATQSFNNTWNNPTITDTAGLTWTVAQVQADVSVAQTSAAVWVAWASCPTAQTNMTATATFSIGGSGQTIWFSSIAAEVFTGADTSAPIGAVTKGATSTTAVTAAITPLGSGSALYVLAAVGNANSAVTTAGSGEFLLAETHTGTSVAIAWNGTSSGPTIPASAQTLDLTSAATAPRTQYIAFEIKAAAATSTTYQGASAMTAGHTLSADATVTRVAVVTMTASSTLTPNAVRTQPAVVTMTATHNSTVNGVREQGGAVAMTATSATTANATTSATQQANVVMTATETLSSTAFVTTFGSVVLVVAETLTANAVPTRVATVAMSVANTLTTDGVVTRLAVATMTATEMTTADGFVTRIAVVTMVASNALLTDGITTRFAVVAMTAGSTLTSNAVASSILGVSMTATHTLASSVFLITQNVVAFTATTLLTTDGLVTKLGNVSMTVFETLSTDEIVTRTGAVSLTAIHALTSNVIREQFAVVAMTVACNLSSSGITTRVAILNMSAVETLASSAQTIYFGAVTMSAIDVVTATASGVGVWQAIVSMTAIETLSVNGIATLVAGVNLVSAETLSVSGIVTRPASVVMTALETLITDGFVIQSAVITLAATSVLTSDGLVSKTSLIAMSASHTLTAASIVTRVAVVSMTASHASAVSGTLGMVAVVSMMATETTLGNATGFATVIGASAMVASHTMLISPSVMTGATVLISSVHALVVAGITSRVASVVLAATHATTADARTTRLAAALLTAAHSLGVSARLTQFAVVTMTALHTLAAQVLGSVAWVRDPGNPTQFVKASVMVRNPAHSNRFEPSQVMVRDPATGLWVPLPSS